METASSSYNVLRSAMLLCSMMPMTMRMVTVLGIAVLLAEWRSF